MYDYTGAIVSATREDNTFKVKEEKILPLYLHWALVKKEKLRDILVPAVRRLVM